MGQTEFTNGDLEFTQIGSTNTAKVKRAQNADRNILNIPETCTINDIQCTVVEIESQGFYQANGLQKVTIPSTITTIGSEAFRNCGNLKEVTINGENLSTIGYSAFYQCGALAEIFIPGSVTSVGAEAFAYCGSLHEVRFGAPTSSNLPITLGQGAFKNCHSMHSIYLPKNLTAIPDNLLSDCHNFNEIIIPENVTSVGAYAFQNTHDCEIIFLGCGDCGTITIHSTAFQNCNAEDISFLCLSTGGVDIVKPNGDSGTMTWGNNARFHVPCGMENLYTDEITQGSNITIDATNCVSVSRQSGPFCLPETWVGYDNWNLRQQYESVDNTYAAKEAWLKNYNSNPDDDRYPNFVPRKPEHPFYINSEHTVELNHSRHIYPFNSINEGVLKVNAPAGGQLIERDSIIFDGLYTLNVEYKVTKEEGQIYITRNNHDKTNITTLINASNDEVVGNEYKKERNIYIRNIKTQELIPLGLFSNISENQIIEILSNNLTEHDYYELTPDNSNELNYYGPYTDGGVQWNMSSGLSNFGLDISNSNFNQQLQNKASGLYSDGDYVWHVFTYEGKKTATKIQKSTGNVTLHGTDYAYGHVKMHENLGGEIEIVVPATQGQWNFIGAPFNGYDLWSVKIGPGGSDVTIVEFDYNNKQWSNIFSTVDDEINPGEGFLAWPFYDGGIIFSTKRDGHPTLTEVDFALNNDDVVVTKKVDGTAADGRWMALANPYPAKLCVNSFVGDNTSKLQGQGVYILTSEVGDDKQKFAFKPLTDENANKYDLGVGQGFFVNVVENSNPTSITFKKNQLHEYDESTCVHENHNHAKSTTIKEFVKIVMVEGGNETELLFAQNQNSEQGYDIYDANKLFSMDEVAEPYFVTDNIALVKEEVKDLPYYATMNVKSFGEKEVSFKATEIPEGYLVSIIDGEEVISLNNGGVYTTNITAGENADRFKILFGSSVGLEDVENTTSNIQITNSDRTINITTMEKDLNIEVYNALGQKVYETRNYNFTLNNLSAGAYMVKAYNKTSSQTTKVIIK